VARQLPIPSRDQYLLDVAGEPANQKLSLTLAAAISAGKI
jgi:hypothetical protein